MAPNPPVVEHTQTTDDDLANVLRQLNLDKPRLRDDDLLSPSSPPTLSPQPPATMNQQGPKVLLQRWGEGSDFFVDPEKSPKAEFARLAKVKGWVGGDRNWCTHWKTCFKEDYPYGVRHRSRSSTTNTAEADAVPNSVPDLADQMRHPSVGSDASSFEIVPRTSRSGSFGSGRSRDSTGSRDSWDRCGRARSRYSSRVRSRSSSSRSLKSLDSWNSSDSRNSALSVNSVQSFDSIAGGIVISETRRSTDAQNGDELVANAVPKSPTSSPFWSQFLGFTPTPTATFKDEFTRLANLNGWDKNSRYKYLVEALNTEIAFHYGIVLHKLDRWQELCKDVGVEDVPTSITKCKKALKSVFVNLFNLINHKRNPEINIVDFKSRHALCRNIRAGKKFPKNCAKQDGFIRVLLTKM
ncbi:hypothetical protein EJ02DRAFT_449343 [Clathrospora elynae]|uniref:Uncharacterized protein n=1 Tax=Clathrospora elynae TaxID=706981 RepID=A0A6A5TAT3_9PLEO|nr:hypothetical protein EJ02DRAFT_449343 [Clathrospora elynae]